MSELEKARHSAAIYASWQWVFHVEALVNAILDQREAELMHEAMHGPLDQREAVREPAPGAKDDTVFTYTKGFGPSDPDSLAAQPDPVAPAGEPQPLDRLERRPAFWTHDDEAAKDVGHLYYFAPANRTPPPYKRQIFVKAVVDVASDGTLAGVELIDDMPPPPSTCAVPVAPAGIISSPEREEAIRGMMKALERIRDEGPDYTVPAIVRVLVEPALAAARSAGIKEAS